MTIIYHLFLEKEVNINDIFRKLSEIRIPGVIYKYIDQNYSNIISSSIVIESLYKDIFIKQKVKDDLISIGYKKKFKLMKPLTREEVLDI